VSPLNPVRTNFKRGVEGHSSPGAHTRRSTKARKQLLHFFLSLCVTKRQNQSLPNRKGPE
jgi:hypothetical protein